MDAVLAALPAGARRIIAIAGESGTGKTTLADRLRAAHPASVVLHLDDYYRLAPRANHAARLEDPGRVGPGEVRLDLLADHVTAFRRGATAVAAPAVDRARDRIGQRRVSFDGADLLIVEGTWALRLPDADLRVFIDGDWRQTHERRMARARDLIDDSTAGVLDTEHRLLRADRRRADLVVDHGLNSVVT